MGFYIRKSFKAGPVRLNLSKSGIGLSAGVTGARVGISGDGRAYSHVGRHGLYARDYYGGKRNTGGASSGPVSNINPPIELMINTGVTYGEPLVVEHNTTTQDHAVRKIPAHGLHSFLLIVNLALVCILGYSAISSQRTGPVVLLVLLLLPLWAGTRAVRISRRRTQEGTAYGDFLAVVCASGVIDDQIVGKIKVRVESPLLREGDRQFFGQISYAQLLRRVLEDLQVEDAELRALSDIADSLSLPSGFIDKENIRAFRTYFLEMAGDHALTEPEEIVLNHFRKRLGIPESSIAEELALIRELQTMRDVSRGILPILDTPINLAIGEVCHFADEGRILKSIIVQTYQRSGQRYKTRGLKVLHEGQIVITSKRLLIIHGGTTTISLEKILDTELDWDRKLITVSRDGVQSPLLLTTPNAAVAAAILSNLTSKMSCA